MVTNNEMCGVVCTITTHCSHRKTVCFLKTRGLSVHRQLKPIFDFQFLLDVFEIFKKVHKYFFATVAPFTVSHVSVERINSLCLWTFDF